MELLCAYSEIHFQVWEEEGEKSWTLLAEYSSLLWIYEPVLASAVQKNWLFHLQGSVDVLDVSWCIFITSVQHHPADREELNVLFLDLNSLTDKLVSCIYGISARLECGWREILGIVLNSFTFTQPHNKKLCNGFTAVVVNDCIVVVTLCYCCSAQSLFVSNCIVYIHHGLVSDEFRIM